MAVLQLVLPGIAARSIRDRLAGSGTDVAVTVRAFPAIKLLWRDANEVDVRMSSYSTRAPQVGSLLSEASGADTVHVRIGTFRSGVVTAHDVVVDGHGQRFTASATILDTDLQQATAGFLRSVTPVSSGDGTLTLRGTLLAGGATVDATVAARDGTIVVASAGGGLLGLVATLLGPVTVFSDPHVHVDSVSGGPAPGGIDVRATATLS